MTALNTRPTFKRYEGANIADDGIRMPTLKQDARVSTLCISEVLGRLEEFTKDDYALQEMFPWAKRFVMGFPLPDWQRPLVWSQEQKTRFISSIWAGLDIGSYLLNDQYEYVDGKQGQHFRKFSEVLLDGQQRLSAIEDYVLNKFAVPDATGTLRFWSELPQIERRRFGHYHFARSAIRTWNEHELRLAYDLRAFGGTAHTEDQRALPGAF